MKDFLISAVLLIGLTSYATSETQFYDVKKNDTLWSISQQFSVGIDELKTANQINNERTLQVGMRLIIPSTYQVEKGDTLWGIARKMNTSVQVLRELNQLDDDELNIGDVLLVPAITGKTVSSDVAASTVAETSTSGHTSAISKVSPMSDLPFWPHEGARNVRSGKLSGTEFQGKKGDDVISIASGEVVWNAPNRGYGNVIIIESADRYLYLYTGLSSTLVKLGERVAAGTTIATLGVDPHTGQAKLFLSVYKNGSLVDPAAAPRG